jgi:hypothetical protein
MVRFLVLVVLCLLLVGSACFLLVSAVQQPGNVRSLTGPKPGDVVLPVGSEAELPDPGQNLEAKLRSLIDDRDRRVAEAWLEVGRAATEVLQLVSQIQIVRADFERSEVAYYAQELAASGLGPLLSAAGAALPDPDMPEFPIAEIQGLEVRFHSAASQFAIAKNGAENRVQMIQNEFLRQFIDIVGKRRASEAPPVPHTAADAMIRRAGSAIADFPDFMTKIYEH